MKKMLFILLCGISWTAQAQSYHTPNTTTQSQPLVIRSASMAVNYQIAGIAPQDLARVELWYAQGANGDWQLYAYDEDLTSPIQFMAPGEGYYRLLVVAVDRWNRCSYTPTGVPSQDYQGTIPPGIAAHLHLTIDYTQPRLYLYNPRLDTTASPGQPLRVQWAGFDTNLGPLPVMLYYQNAGSENWIPLNDTGYAASGDLLWTIPTASVAQSFRVKAVMQDNAKNTAEQVSGWVQFTETASPAVTSPPPAQANSDVSNVTLTLPAQSSKTTPASQSATSVNAPSQPAPVQPTPSQPAPAPTPPQQSTTTQPHIMPSQDTPAATTAPSSLSPEQIHAKVLEYYALGNLHSQRMEWDRAIEAYQQALSYDPGHQDTQVQLGFTYYNAGRYAAAKEQFNLILLSYPDWNNALFGMAQSEFALGDYDNARMHLEKILQKDPSDWYAWILLGDTASKLGKRDLAIRSWQTASTGARESSPGIVRIAQERLDTLNP